MGLRQDFFKKRLSALITVSDVFNSSASKSTVNTPDLVQESLRKRDGPVLFGGLVFNFTSNSQKEKEVKFEFDNSVEK
jgi:hypothetical protein